MSNGTYERIKIFCDTLPLKIFSWFCSWFAFAFVPIWIWRSGKDALFVDIFYHQECQRAYATHASLWWLLSIYLASYFIQLIWSQIFSRNVFLLLRFFFLFLCHWWGLSGWKVFMRYLRCHIFNIEMPSCLVLLKRRRKYAKLIFSNFFAFDRYRKYKALQKVFYSTKHKVNSKTKCCIKT